MTYNLARFKEAQARDYRTALAEIRNGRKASHWIWYVFPQLKALGRSGMAKHYGIEDMAEAKAYLADPDLRARLIEISRALLELATSDPVRVMGSIDSLKLRSSMTLFSLASNTDPVFKQVLRKYYGGEADALTLELLERRQS